MPKYLPNTMMARPSTSINAFFSPVSSPSKSPRRGEPSPAPTMTASIGDGFTDLELRSDDLPASEQWQPQNDFEDVNIGELSPGPRRVSFTARVVNVYDQIVHSKVQKSARGCLKVLVKDDSALLLVRHAHFAV
jgi:hypothetical protein